MLRGDWNSLAASLVEAGPSDVAHPFDDVMIGVVQLGLEHLKLNTNVNETIGDGNKFYFRLNRDNGQPSTDIQTTSTIHFKKGDKM
jgi:hypothetical protein